MNSSEIKDFALDILIRYRQMAEKQVADALDMSPAEVRRGMFLVHSAYHKILKLAVPALAAQLQLDDELTVNWVNVENGDYRSALNRLVAFCIAVENDPRVSVTARNREEELQGLRLRVTLAESSERAIGRLSRELGNPTVRGSADEGLGGGLVDLVMLRLRQAEDELQKLKGEVAS